MGLFNLMKKRRSEELPLPPPPPPALTPMLRGDIEPIRAETPSQEEHFEPPLPELPRALPGPTQDSTAGAWKPSVSGPLEQSSAGEREVRIFDRTIAAEAVEEEQPVRETVRASPKPSFVAVEDYKRIINDTNTIRSKLMDAENFVRRLSDLKNEEERAFEKWRTQLEDVEKKLNYVDHLIAKAQS